MKKNSKKKNIVQKNTTDDLDLVDDLDNDDTENPQIVEDAANFARIITIIAVLIIIVATYFYLTAPEVDKKKVNINNSEIKTEVEIGGDFELKNLNGIKENTIIYKGRPRLVYFGFTYCPDICPNSLNIISHVLDNLNKYNIDIVPIFITVDPKRDTAKVLKPFLAHFNKNIIGYTGTDEEIKKVADQFKAYYAVVKREDASEDDYLVDHTSFIYLLDSNGKYIKHFSSTSSVKEITEYIRINLKK